MEIVSNIVRGDVGENGVVIVNFKIFVVFFYIIIDVYMCYR